MPISSRAALARIAAAPLSRVGRRTVLAPFSSPEGKTWEGVADSPEDLAREAGLALGTYVLARNVRSEEGRSLISHRLAIAELARNKALATNVTVAWLLTRRVAKGYEFTRGHVGRQRGRWAATTLDPRGCDVATATIALYEQSRLLPTTAVKYFDPAAQDARSGRAYTDHVLEKWTSEGCRWIGPVVVDGAEVIDPFGLMIFTEHERRPVDNAQAAEVIKRGRAGDRVDSKGALRGLLLGGAVALAVIKGLA